MKYCQKCGKELVDEAVICVNCGCSVISSTTNAQHISNVTNSNIGETSSTANLAVLFAFLVPIVGLIFGIIGVVKYHTPLLKIRCIASIIISIIVWTLTLIIIAGL